MKFKLDENLSPSLSAILSDVTQDIHSVTDQALNGQPDERVIDVCRQEGRALITLDLDFSNIQAYPPAKFAGIIVMRLRTQAHDVLTAALRNVAALLSQQPLAGTLWIVEENRIRIHE
ncbi:MAG: DUF5615 family PIN-like protein [Steroidobacteraceae bacterium]